MPERIKVLQNWLEESLGVQTPQLMPLANDASFRRYFRLIINNIPHIVMDAPPDKEDCTPFIEISRRLRASGLNAPKIIAEDLTQGFLLLSDLGSQLYLTALDEQQVESLYGDALRALLTMQISVSSENLPLYDQRLLHQEMRLFTDWLLKTHLHLTLSSQEESEIATCFERLSASALAQPQVFVHRDYHSRNLMVVPSHNPGILDFQDAVKGAITYDLVSLLRDCYIAWSRPRVENWAKNYYDAVKQSGLFAKTVSEQQFLKWFDWMGIQRHLKASGIFARLYRRDGKVGYLKDIPRTLNYIVEVGADYPELAALHSLITERVFTAIENNLS